MRKPALYYGPKPGVEWPLNRFSVGESNHGPPFFFKSKRTGRIAVTLSVGAMRAAIDLNDDLVFQEGEVHYSPMTKEWVLDSIRLSDQTKALLKGALWLSLSAVEASPITEEHWGPYSP